MAQNLGARLKEALDCQGKRNKLQEGHGHDDDGTASSRHALTKGRDEGEIGANGRQARSTPLRLITLPSDDRMRDQVEESVSLRDQVGAVSCTRD